jgi:hypothetical protein
LTVTLQSLHLLLLLRHLLLERGDLLVGGLHEGHQQPGLLLEEVHLLLQRGHAATQVGDLGGLRGRAHGG